MAGSKTQPSAKCQLSCAPRMLVSMMIKSFLRSCGNTIKFTGFGECRHLRNAFPSRQATISCRDYGRAVAHVLTHETGPPAYHPMSSAGRGVVTGAPARRPDAAALRLF